MGLLRRSGGCRRALGAAASAIFAIGALGSASAGSAIAFTSPAPTAPDGASTWGVQPASESGEATRPAFAYHMEPGAVVDDAVRVTNSSEHPLTLRVSAHDAFNTQAGDFDVLTSAAESVEVGAWVELDVEEVVVPARGSVDVPFRLTVPSNASPGDHAGGIVASRAEPVVAADGSDLVVDHRVGARIYVRVDGPLRPALVVSDFDGRFEPEGLLGTSGAVVVSYTIRNTGNTRLSATQMLAVEGPLGLGRHTVELADLPELLPGAEFTDEVAVDHVRSFGRLSASLTFETSTAPPDVVETSTSVWAIPWRALVLVALVVTWLVWRRRSRRPAAQPDPSDGTSASDAATAPEPEPTGTPTVSRSLLAIALLVPVGLTTAPDDQTPTSQIVQLDTAVATVGGTVAVSLAGWPRGPAQIELCGNGARRGSVDCNQLGAVAAAVDDNGTATADLPITRPPSECPCVVRVSQVHSGATATVPIEVVGVLPVESTPAGDAPSAAPARRLEVAVGDVVADEGNRAWFGTDVGRQVGVTVRNGGSVRLDDVAVAARVSGGLGTSVVVDSPPPFDLEPGAERLVTLSFDLPAPAVGDYRIEGRVDGGDEPVTFSATTSHVPWGLVNAVVLAAAAIAVFAARRRWRPQEAPAAAWSSVPETGQDAPQPVSEGVETSV